VLEIDPATFQVRRRIFASRARWSATQKVWGLEGSWVRDFADARLSATKSSPRFISLPELTEPPSYFQPGGSTGVPNELARTAELH